MKISSGIGWCEDRLMKILKLSVNLQSQPTKRKCGIGNIIQLRVPLYKVRANCLLLCREGMAAIFNTTLPFSNFTTSPAAKRIFIRNFSLCSSTKRDGTFPAVASPSSPQMDVGYLQTNFRTSGVSFTGLGDSCVVRMELDNGTATNVMLPSGLITSFKAQMWHGGTMELLHTSVSEGEDSDSAAVIRGGLSLALLFEIHHSGDSWSPGAWTLHQVSGTPQESIQIELISRSEQGHVEVKNVITLEKDLLNSEIQVSNSTTSSVHLVGSTVCHLTVSTPDAVYAVGLEGSDYFDRQPFHGDFSIIPPDLEKSSLWTFSKLFPNWGADVKVEDDAERRLEGEEDDNYKHLTEKISRFYTSAPRNLTIIDRGRRNSVTVKRKGFKEVHILSPGSEHESYGKYSYICIGHAAQLEPVTLAAQSKWTGGVQLLNPNS